jgi:hypothetical protein
MWRSKKVSETINADQDAYLWEAFLEIRNDTKVIAEFKLRISEIVWSSSSHKEDVAIQESFLTTANQLLAWLKANFPEPAAKPSLTGPKLGLWATPECWRKLLKSILYKDPTSRIALAAALHYMPVQVIYALADKKIKKNEQRLYQFFYSGNDPLDEGSAGPLLLNLLSEEDVKKLTQFWRYEVRNRAAFFLENHLELLKELNIKEITVPFLSFFEEELNEIEASRSNRRLEFNEDEVKKFPLPLKMAAQKHDPEKKADEMQLAGLAFSGGGIRSATFNLGILQKLAELGALPRFDYLSTVSGGGYIGSWYTSWIYRKKSVKKVVDRLNCKKSANPLAEEVRPIRWLRMFSNYLSPNSSIMSADSWTVGTIWLRNTIINQVVLLSILVTLLAAINLCYEGWLLIERLPFSSSVFLGSLFLILVGVYFSSSGMSTYHKEDSFIKKFLFHNKRKLPHYLVGWTFLSGVILTLFFVCKDDQLDYFGRINLLWPSGISCFVGMILIALIGGYHTREEKKMGLKKDRALRLAILASSAIASVAFVFLLAACWIVLRHEALKGERVFVFGIPLVMEVFCITVVVRMVIMGNFFPDERREWWGRMGAVLHRFIFWWIIVTYAVLLFPADFNWAIDNSRGLLPLIGGWAGLIGVAVRMAYTSSTSGAKQGSRHRAKDLFIRIAPYLFMAGFLLIGAFVLKLIEGLKEMPLRSISSSWEQLDPIERSIWLLLILTMVTLVLSWRAGVNEFSLHDFYKNRLIRAYLGATRRRTDREQTANGFTGFDKEDDIPLVQMTGKYSGPYPLINTTLNATTSSELDRQDRMAESFVFSPLYCGFDINPTRSSSSVEHNGFKFGYRPTKDYSRQSGPFLGTAIAISGAAVSPNMGYHSSAATSFLLTIFNVRLGQWIGNPRKASWKNSDPRLGLGYLLSDLVGKSDVDADYVYLSDGGHFDNMGLYELIRRRCCYIVLGDGEQDENSSCEGLANAIRRCRIDFGVEIDLDVTKITDRDSITQLSSSHFVKGKIRYPDTSADGTIIYIKASITNANQADIREYHLKNPKFPQQSTGDQFFDEAQFESYRKLGYDSIKDFSDLSPI